MEAANLKQKYLTKVIQFNGHKMTLYSLDGLTWSSKKFELTEIQERRELQRIALAGKKDELELDSSAGAEGARPVKHDDYDDLDEQADLDIDAIEDPVLIKDDLEAIPLKSTGAHRKVKIIKPKVEIKKPKKLRLAQTPAIKVSKLPKKPKTADIKSKKLVAKPKVKKAQATKVQASKTQPIKSAKKVSAKKTAKKVNRKKAA